MNEYEKNMKYVRVRRKRKKRARNMALLVIFLIIAVIAGAAGGIIYYVGYYNSLNGTWVTKYDYLDEVSADIAVWMSDIEDADIDDDWVKSHIDALEVNACMELNNDSLTEGSYRIYIDEDSYRECEKKAEVLLASCLKEIIAGKLVERGYKESLTEEENSALVTDILGCSMEEYIRMNNLSLMPSFEDVNSRIFDEGTYKLSMGQITKFNSRGLYKEEFLVDEDMLVLPENEIIYRKQVEK